jgi:diaminopimelate decarboxylase
MEPIEFSLLPDSAAIGADGSVIVGGCSLLDVAAEFGTPAFVYDAGHIRARCREAVDAFGRGRVVYAT